MTYAAQQDDSHHATITVARILQPKAPRKPAWIEGADGVRYSIWPDKLGQFREGESYEIEFQTSNGYHNIKSARAATKPSPAPGQFTGGRSNPPARSLSSAASPPAGAPQQNYRPTAPKDARRMWLCSQLNAMIESRQVSLTTESLIEANRMLMDVYDATIGLEDDQ